MLKHVGIIIVFIIAGFVFTACNKDKEVTEEIPVPVDTTKPFKPTPFTLTLPPGWPPMKIPADNQLSVEGIELGRKLFYDPILSKNNTMSCGSCHNINNGFTDNGKRFSEGLNGELGTRNAMPIFNLGWVENYVQDNHMFFWDGGAANLESQVLGPITNPIEMNETVANVIDKLKANPVYPGLFKKAFGTDSITSKRLMQAIAQFERTIISFGSRFDMYMVTKNKALLSAQEWRGYDVFNTEGKGDCFHCHNVSTPFSSDFQFHHNGHQSTDEGLKRITGKTEDVGKFRTPSLRNLVLTAPYMHDGRFNTLEEVVEFYNSGAIRQWPADELISKHPTGLNLTSEDKADLVSFLKTLTDSTLLTKTQFMKP